MAVQSIHVIEEKKLHYCLMKTIKDKVFNKRQDLYFHLFIHIYKSIETIKNLGELNNQSGL